MPSQLEVPCSDIYILHAVHFSENYIFGKFDTFSRRLEKIADMVTMIDSYRGLADVRVDGIETINTKYKNIVETTKKRNYDVLDHRKQEVCGLHTAIIY